MPIVVGELAAAARCYPIVFAAGDAQPIAVISLERRNLFDSQRTPLETEARALETQRATLSADQLRQTLQQAAAQSSREIEATRVKALERIANEVQPVIAQVYRQKNCGLLFDRGALLGGNFANDLTADVVCGLDARIQTITFERERLPAPAASPRRADRLCRLYSL